MAKYSSAAEPVEMSAESAYARLSDLQAMQGMLDQLPAEAREKMGDMHFGADEIVIGTPQVGNITLAVTERRPPELIRMEAAQSPVPVAMSIHIHPTSAESCTVEASIELEIPAMLRPLIGGKMQEAASKFGEMLALILKH